jgi:MFS family permease
VGIGMLRENFNLTLANKRISLQATLAWSSVLFTIFQLLLEMLTNTMTNQLMLTFNINHMQLGLLSSAFFYTFLIMQIPAGIILDKFNIKSVLSITCAGCGLGCLFFGYASNFTYALISRSIMGAFAAFGFLGLLKISALYFKPKLFPFLVGFSQFLVMIATSFGEPIILHKIENYSWRIILINAGYFAFFISSLIFLFVKPQQLKFSSHKMNFFNNFSAFIKSKHCWLASLYGFGMYSVISSFSALWGLSYLTTIYHLSSQEAALALSINFAGVAIGCSILGILSSFLNNYIKILRLCAIISFILILSLIFIKTLALTSLYLIFFLLGVLCSSYFLCFDIVKKSSPAHTEGIAIALCNIFVMSSTILIQPMMGFLIDIGKTISDNQLNIGYNLSMIALIFSMLISIMASFLKKDTIGKLSPDFSTTNQ